MAIRPRQDWRKILDGMTPRAKAARILSDLTDYRHASHESDDVESLANALAAVADLDKEGR